MCLYNEIIFVFAKKYEKVYGNEESVNNLKKLDTIDYYNNHAVSFIEETIRIDFSEIQDKFLEKLKNGAKILDFGCGSGRDTKYFLSKNFEVCAIDGAKELCTRAEQYTGISVKQLLFQELDEKNQYDGIWACASILHLTTAELKQVFPKMETALKENGIIYTSFKYGTWEGERNGRYFTDLTERTFVDILVNCTTLHIEEQWISTDARPERGKEQWLNVILRKTTIA